MASSAVDLCQIVTENGVNALLNTLIYGERKFLVWTRLSLENSSWIINTSDGINVWKLEMDREHVDSYRALTQVDTCEAFLSKIRSDFHAGNLMINPEASKVSLIVGTTESILRLDLYEASNDERKIELQHLILWMADNITTLTDKLKATTESLEQLRTQKDSTSTASSMFDLPPKKVQAATVKRKPGYSLVNPGSRNDSLPTDLETGSGNLEATDSVHLSVLAGSQMLDVYRCPDPPNCQFPCTKSNRRYHCPLCDNRPQKPGRMRRHFFTMHAGKHVIEHEGYRILRCKLKCTRSNGRIADCSHYHCCLCGRVCLRKVHLCCHLQAHALGTAKDVEDDLMDASKVEEEQDDEEPEEDEDGDDDTAEETVLQTSQMACGIPDSGQAENMVTLADGTQVVYVQSLESGETLTVVPVSSQSDSIQIPTGELNPSLQVLASSQSNNPIEELGAISQESDGQHLDVILNHGDNRVVSSSGNSVSTNTSTGITSFRTYTSRGHDPPRQTLPFGQPYNELTNTGNPTQGNVIVFDRASSNTAVPAMQKTQGIPGVPCDLGSRDAMEVGLPGVNNSLDINDLVSSTPVAASQVGSIVGNQSATTHTMSTPLRNESMIASDSSSQFSSPPFNDNGQPIRTYKSPDSDSLLLLKSDQTSQGDDTVFNKLFSDIKPRVENLFQHASVVADQIPLQVSRCKNTECDCRLYHCPLCTCLPNKPGRIREHFRKIHSENLIIRYQGYQMLRCKLGCCRSTGKRILNSHYHCCLCGCICISKSGVYEHMRTQHTESSLKTESSSLNAEKRKSTTVLSPTSSKKQAPDESQSPSKLKPEETPQIQRPFMVQIPPFSASNNQRIGGQPVEQTGGVGVSQQQNEAQGSSNQPQQQQQPLVIVMPQQLQNYSQGQGQQPIVIVMPQGGSGGTVQMAQPYVVPMPQPVNH